MVSQMSPDSFFAYQYHTVESRGCQATESYTETTVCDSAAAVYSRYKFYYKTQIHLDGQERQIEGSMEVDRKGKVEGKEREE